MPNLPNPSLNSIKGVLVLVAAVALAIALLTGTNIGRQVQGALNSAAAALPV